LRGTVAATQSIDDTAILLLFATGNIDDNQTRCSWRIGITISRKFA